MRQLNKTFRKLGVWRLYLKAVKLHGFSLTVTGDIDDSAHVSQNPALLEEWATYASLLGTRKPILYVTANGDFGRVKDAVPLNVVVGVHGLTHTHYAQVHSCFAKQVASDIMRESMYSRFHRFPYLDYNMRLLKLASLHFQVDSSIVSSRMYPFKIGGMTEYPITPPTDTALRGKPVTEEVMWRYAVIIQKARRADKPLTLLLHPNPWSVNLLKRLTSLNL